VFLKFCADAYPNYTLGAEYTGSWDGAGEAEDHHIANVAGRYMNLTDKEMNVLFGPDGKTEKQKAKQIRRWAENRYPEEYKACMDKKKTEPLPAIVHQPVKEREKV